MAYEQENSIREGQIVMNEMEEEMMMEREMMEEKWRKEEIWRLEEELGMEEEMAMMGEGMSFEGWERLYESPLWRSKEAMMDELLMRRIEAANEDSMQKPIMDEDWMEEPLMDEARRMLEQSIKNEKSIMNQEWRVLVGEVMDKESMTIVRERRLGEEFMDEELETSMRKKQIMDEEFLINEELIMENIYEEARAFHRDMWKEETMDYEQSIMDEMMGWQLTSSVMEIRQSTFRYSALDQPEHEIRVVRLQPRRWQTDPIIICDITTLDLRTNPWYEALSYEWGSPSTSKEYTIRLNNKSIVVRQNLWWALYELRYTREPRTLWIDAICINQSDIHEKNYQVSRMGNIYSQAARVVAWIGQANYQSDYSIVSQLSISAERFFRFDSSCPPWKHRCNWPALDKLCSRSYWSRLWIIQEVLLASELYVQCGSQSFRWEELSNIFDCLRQDLTAICSSWTKLSLISSVPFRLDMRRKSIKWRPLRILIMISCHSWIW